MTTYFDQQKTSYNETGSQDRVISEVIQLLDPRDTPLLDALGGLDAGRSKLKISKNGKKIEWLEDELAPLTGAVSNGTVAITTNATNWTVADASIFQDGTTILIDSEYMVVKAVDVTNNTVTVYARDFGGTNATHATNAAIEIVGMNRLEGDDADYVGLVQLENPYNYSSIFQKALNVSGTDQAIDYLGFADPKEYQAAKAIPELLRLVEKAIFHGIRAVGTAAAPRSFGGLGTFITNNTVTAGSAVMDKTDLDGLLEAIYSDGGNPDLFVCHPSTAADLKNIMDSSSYVQVGLDNSQLGMNPLRSLVTQFSTLRLVMSRFCPSTTAYVLDSKRIGLYTLRPFAWHDLAKTGDGDKIEVVGELSLAVANDKAHGKVIAITT